MFHKCSQNDVMELCRSFCTTYYCPYFWTQHKKATFSKLRVAYNNVYRKVFGLKRRSNASDMFVLNISNFKALMRKSIVAFTTQSNVISIDLFHYFTNNYILLHCMLNIVII